MQRVGFEMKIHPEMVDEYKQRHDDISGPYSHAASHQLSAVSDQLVAALQHVPALFPI